MKEAGKRLRVLREGAMLSQAKMAEALGSTQSSINRYENGQSTPSVSLFRAYADYFDVSMDYIFARTDKPKGKLYEYKPRITAENQQMRQFIDMCFDPGSPVGGKMKETLLRMITEET
ncbi:MAG: helix-turn-helix domain-containing protein [Clostridia bacterium]|nr:helix-turn-helix domain-containing protein [Clostridia bacterium]